MGWDYAIRFKGIVKEQYRSIFKEIALHGKWEDSTDELFCYIGKSNYSASCIPVSETFAKRGWPLEWAGCDEEGEEFALQYDEQSGLWVFGTVFRDNTYLQIDFMVYVLPYAFENVMYMETWCQLEEHPVYLAEMMCDEDMEYYKSHYLDMSTGYPKWIEKVGYPK